jgi:hypothetical protein
VFGEYVADWLRGKLAGVQVNFFNRGIGATGASFPSMCADELLSGISPTLVFVEFSANVDEEWSIPRLIYYLQSLRPQPTVLFVDIFTMNGNAMLYDAWQRNTSTQLPMKLGNFGQQAYTSLHLTCLSLGAAFTGASDDLKPLLASAFASSYSYDGAHMSTIGHALVAEFAASYLRVFVSHAVESIPSANPVLPHGPLVSHVCYSSYGDKSLGPSDVSMTLPKVAFSTEGWTFGAIHGHDNSGFHLGNSSRQSVGSFIAFELSVSADMDVIAVGAQVSYVNNLYGVATISLDGLELGTVDGYHSRPYTIHRMKLFEVSYKAGKHLVGFRIQNFTRSGGFDFAIMSIVGTHKCVRHTLNLVSKAELDCISVNQTWN